MIQTMTVPILFISSMSTSTGPLSRRRMGGRSAAGIDPFVIASTLWNNMSQTLVVFKDDAYDGVSSCPAYVPSDKA